MPNILSLLNDRLTAVGAIAAAIVGLNGALTTCSTDTTNRYSAFRGAVSGEETFWKDRFTEYSEDVAVKDPDERHGKLMALAALSQHQVPTFEEFWLGPFVTSPKNAAREQLNNLRQSLITALSNDRDQQVADLVRQSAHFEKTEQAAKPQDGVATDAPRTQKTQAAPQAPTLATQVIGIGSTTGWDLDVFWCTTDNDAGNAANYDYARTVATALGVVASRQHSLAPGVMLGRVQLRPLPQLVQGTADYPVRGSGNTLLVDNDSGEQEAAAALLKVLTGSNLALPFTARTTTAPDGSKYYMSAYVCGAPPKPSATTAGAPANQAAPAPAQGSATGSTARAARGGAVLRR